jgi:hypothetical protein
MKNVTGYKFALLLHNFGNSDTPPSVLAAIVTAGHNRDRAGEGSGSHQTSNSNHMADSKV